MTLFERSQDLKKYRAPTTHDSYCVSKENESLFSFLRFTFSSLVLVKETLLRAFCQYIVPPLEDYSGPLWNILLIWKKMKFWWNIIPPEYSTNFFHHFILAGTSGFTRQA